MVLRIFKMIATSGCLTALECIKFDFVRGSAPDPTGRDYSAPRPCSWFTGLYLRGGAREGEKKGREEGDRKGREDHPFANSSIRPWLLGTVLQTTYRGFALDPTGDFRLPDPPALVPFTLFLIHPSRIFSIVKYCRTLMVKPIQITIPSKLLDVATPDTEL